MSPSTVHFLVNLSHKWAGIVMMMPIVFGVAAYLARVLLMTARASGVDTKAATMFRNGTAALFTLSIFTFIVSFLHIGCAYLVRQAIECEGNERQLSAAMLMYAADFDDTLPPANRWSEAARPYVSKTPKSEYTAREPHPFQCPDAESPASYGMNAAVSGIPIDELDSPCDEALLFDANAETMSFAGGVHDLAGSRHGGRPNIAYCDGHTESYRTYSVKHTTWALTLASTDHLSNR